MQWEVRNISCGVVLPRMVSLSLMLHGDHFLGHRTDQDFSKMKTSCKTKDKKGRGLFKIKGDSGDMRSQCRQNIALRIGSKGGPLNMDCSSSDFSESILKLLGAKKK